MEHTSIPEPPGFAKLSKVEQIRYLQALWNRISENPDDIPVSESHLQVAEERLSENLQHPDQARPAYEILNRLSKKST